MVQAAGYSKSQIERALRLVERADRWAEGVRKRDGLRFNVFASESSPGVYHFTRLDGAFCTCPAARLSRSGRCHHRLACQILTERARRPRPVKTYEEVWGLDAALTDAF